MRPVWSFVGLGHFSKAAARHKSVKACVANFVAGGVEICEKDARQMDARKNNRLRLVEALSRKLQIMRRAVVGFWWEGNGRFATLRRQTPLFLEYMFLRGARRLFVLVTSAQLPHLPP